jgi:hypothetical protein
MWDLDARASQGFGSITSGAYGVAKNSIRSFDLLDE